MHHEAARLRPATSDPTRLRSRRLAPVARIRLRGPSRRWLERVWPQVHDTRVRLTAPWFAGAWQAMRRMLHA